MSKPNKLSLLFIFIFFIITVFLLPLLIIKELDNPKFDVSIILACLIIIYSGFNMCILAYRNQEKLLQLSFWLFVYIFMGLTPFTQILSGKFAWGSNYSVDQIAVGLMIIIIGIVAYQIGIILAKTRIKTSKLATPLNLNINKPRFFFISFLSLLMSVYLVSKVGGFSGLFLPRAEAASLFDSKIQILLYSNLSKGPILVCLVLGIILWKNKINIKGITPKFLLFILLVANMCLSNPISNPRYWFGTVALTLVFVLFKWKKTSFLILISSYLFVLLVVFPYSDLFRNSATPTFQTHKLTDLLAEKGDYDAFQQLLNIKIFVDQQGIVYGKQLLGAILFWVPRSVWLAKPYGTGQTVAEYLGYSYTNFSCPLWAESYINFGYIGLIIIFGLYGYLTFIFEQKYLLSKKHNIISIWRVLVPFLSAYQFFLLRGDLLNGVAYMSCYILFTLLFCKRRKMVYRERTLRDNLNISLTQTHS